MADRVTALASQGAVVIFGASSSCMFNAVKALFADLGVSSTTVHELDKDPQGKDVESVLAGMVGQSPPVLAVFIGGELVGRTQEIMSLHLGGQLVPLLRQAGAL